jgi:hypothetical protein
MAATLSFVCLAFFLIAVGFAIRERRMTFERDKWLHRYNRVVDARSSGLDSVSHVLEDIQKERVAEAKSICYERGHACFDQASVM